MIAKSMPARFARKNSDPLNPLCPQCRTQANPSNKPWRSDSYQYRGIWAIDTRDHRMARCPACGHEWTLHVTNTIQEFGRRPEGPFYPASSFFDLTPADLHLFEIAFDLGKDDTPPPNAWSYVQLMMGVDGWLSPTNSLIDTLRELAAVVEDGNDTPVFAYDFSVEPTVWHSPGEKIADTVIVKCLAGEQTCDRAWLLDRLKRLVATFEQADHKALAAQYQPVIDVARNDLRWRPERSTAEIPRTWGENLAGCLLFALLVVSTGGIAMWLLVTFDLGLFSFSLITIGVVISAVALFNRYLPD